MLNHLGSGPSSLVLISMILVSQRACLWPWSESPHSWSQSLWSCTLFVAGLSFNVWSTWKF